MAFVRHLEFEKYRFLSDSHPRKGNLHLHLEFAKFRYFCQIYMLGMEICICVPKFYWNRIIHGWDMEIKLFSKWQPSAPWIFENYHLGHASYISMWFCISGPNFALIGHYGAEILPRRFSIWRPSAIFNLQNFDFLLNVHHGNWDKHLPKFGRNRIILGWDMEIKLFLKWRPSAILNLRKLQFWSRELYRHVIFHLCSKFRVDGPIMAPR